MNAPADTTAPVGGFGDLIARGLMFANLVRIDSPALIARYNRALTRIGAAPTALEEISIDIGGYSPEVAAEVGDADYLRPGGGDRHIVLLTTKQRAAPLVREEVSGERELIREFYDANEDCLFALTASDAVVGVIETGIFGRGSAERIAAGLVRLRLTGDTTGRHVEKAAELGELIHRFRAEPRGWADDALIDEMIARAAKVGDVERRPVTLVPVEAEPKSFWIGHEGRSFYAVQGAGLRLFIDPEDLKAPARIAGPLAHLEQQHLTQSIVQRRDTDTAEVIRRMMDFVIVAGADRAGLSLGEGSRADLRRLANRIDPKSIDTLHRLSQVLSHVEWGSDWPDLVPGSPAHVMALRAVPGPGALMTNRLLAELCPDDMLRLFIWHKPLFFRLYESWGPQRQAWVARWLETTYRPQKARLRETTFGSATKAAIETC